MVGTKRRDRGNSICHGNGWPGSKRVSLKPKILTFFLVSGAIALCQTANTWWRSRLSKHVSKLRVSRVWLLSVPWSTFLLFQCRAGRAFGATDRSTCPRMPVLVCFTLIITTLFFFYVVQGNNSQLSNDQI
ncbi:hypothetical protein BX666DRAFT_457165 [Dichotomocladium elegans]|nr:hypothetical protein BX666DRAFT_457165 [Dichotomocladium elegans]